MKPFYFLAIPLALAAVPANAAQPPAHEPIVIPEELTDPRTVERLSEMSEALSQALLDLPVGEIEAAAEGRRPTAADRSRTVGDVAGVSERDIQQKIAAARPKVEAAMQALARALPAMTRALSEAADEIERATANVPQPGYPRR